VLVDKLSNVVNLVVDNHVQAVLGVVAGDVLVAERSGHSGGNVEIGDGGENKKKGQGCSEARMAMERPIDNKNCSARSRERFGRRRGKINRIYYRG